MTHASLRILALGLSFCEGQAFGIYNAMYPEEYIRCGIGTSQTAWDNCKNRPAACYEGISILHNKHYKKWWNGRGSYGMWKCNGT